MICPTLAELPCPPDGKIGWPWTEESERVFCDNPDLFLPKISIVTPTYNQGNYIEETIRSVLLQGYPNLEYIIYDGGSSDETAEILKKYSPWISFWISESDKGQSDAINKGFKKSTGDITAWINSDDLYEEGAFNHAAHAYMQHPDCGLYYGDCLSFSDAGGHSILVSPHKTYSRKLLLQGQYFQQPSSFFNRKCLAEIGYINEDFHFCMDYDLFFRLCEGYSVMYVPETLARFRYQAESKTVSQNYKFLKEIIIILDKIAKTHDLDKKCMDVVLTRTFWSAIKLVDFDVENLNFNKEYIETENISKLASEEWAEYLLNQLEILNKNCNNVSMNQIIDIYSLFLKRFTNKIVNTYPSLWIKLNRALEIYGYRFLQWNSSKHKTQSDYAVSIVTYYPDMVRYRRLIVFKYILKLLFQRKHIWNY